MERVKLTLEVEPELRRRIKLAATARDESIREWVNRALQRELQTEIEESQSGESREEQENRSSTGWNPQGSEYPPRARSGHAVADAVLEDRR